MRGAERSRRWSGGDAGGEEQWGCPEERRVLSWASRFFLLQEVRPIPALSTVGPSMKCECSGLFLDGKER